MYGNRTCGASVDWGRIDEDALHMESYNVHVQLLKPIGQKLFTKVPKKRPEVKDKLCPLISDPENRSQAGYAY